MPGFEHLARREPDIVDAVPVNALEPAATPSGSVDDEKKETA